MAGDNNEGWPEHHEPAPPAVGEVEHAGRQAAAWHEVPAGEPDPHSPHLELGHEDRLPWLEGDDEAYHQPVDHHRVAALVSVALLLLAAVVGTVWFASHRHDAAAPVADGSIVAAGDSDYKSAPAAAGGKTYEGTGDTSFAVSQGKRPDEPLATAPDAKPAAKPGPEATGPAGEADAAAAAASDASGNSPGKEMAVGAANSSNRNAGEGGVVQVAAFNSQARAETAWAQLSGSHPALSGLQHRVVAGQIDSGTVYRLQALTAAGGGGALCAKLHASGMGCQVKQ